MIDEIVEIIIIKWEKSRMKAIKYINERKWVRVVTEDKEGVSICIRVCCCQCNNTCYKATNKNVKSVCGLHQLFDLSATILHADKGYSILWYCLYYCHYFFIQYSPSFFLFFGLFFVLIFVMFFFGEWIERWRSEARQ